jgi:ABC-type phosphate/phosphonate transport system substrate-binding protein
MDVLRSESLRSPSAGALVCCIGRPVGYFLLLLSGAIPGPLATAADNSATPAPKPVLTIGMARSFFGDSGLPLGRSAGLEPIRLLVQTATGVQSDVKKPKPARDLAEDLLAGRLQLAVFQGIEFAWEKQRHPELQALVLAVNGARGRKAHLIIHKDSRAQQWSDLRGTELTIPRCSRQHVSLFAEKNCSNNGLPSQEFFTRVRNDQGAEDALDDVVDRVVEAAAVDGVALTAYARRKPGRFAQLRILASSEKFPDTVVAYRQGNLDQKTLELYREGLLHADKLEAGQCLMTLWLMTNFEEAPPGFDGALAEICKSYPPPTDAIVTVPAKRSVPNRAIGNLQLLASPTKR